MWYVSDIDVVFILSIDIGYWLIVAVFYICDGEMGHWSFS